MNGPGRSADSGGGGWRAIASVAPEESVIISRITDAVTGINESAEVSERQGAYFGAGFFFVLHLPFHSAKKGATPFQTPRRGKVACRIRFRRRQTWGRSNGSRSIPWRGGFSAFWSRRPRR